MAPKTSGLIRADCDRDIAAEFLQTAVQQLAKMQMALRSRSLPDVERLSHRLAGTSAFLGLSGLALVLRELERAASKGDVMIARRVMSRRLQVEFDRIRLHAAPRLKKITSSRVPPRASSKKESKILIVDDHPLLRKGLARLIALQPDMVVCGEAGTAAQALAALEKFHPDVVLLDISLGGSDGVALIEKMQRLQPLPRVLALSVHDESVFAKRALQAGAQGYLMKQDAGKEMIKAIQRILAGKIYVSRKLAAESLGIF